MSSAFAIGTRINTRRILIIMTVDRPPLPRGAHMSMAAETDLTVDLAAAADRPGGRAGGAIRLKVMGEDKAPAWRSRFFGHVARNQQPDDSPARCLPSDVNPTKYGGQRTRTSALRTGRQPNSGFSQLRSHRRYVGTVRPLRFGPAPRRPDDFSSSRPRQLADDTRTTPTTPSTIPRTIPNPESLPEPEPSTARGFSHHRRRPIETRQCEPEETQ